jgi:hypothetical protein
MAHVDRDCNRLEALGGRGEKAQNTARAVTGGRAAAQGKT